MNIPENTVMRNDNVIVEVEGFGVTYDRYVMARQQQILVRECGISSVLESPSYGAKAAGSLYSLGYALGGCEVTVINPEPEPLSYWNELDVRDRLHIMENIDYTHLPVDDNSFDMAWNFVTFGYLDDPAVWLAEMKRVSKRYVMVISCNNIQSGYPWHWAIHKLCGFPWNHGNTYYNYPANVKRFFKDAGLKIAEYGTIDSPPWPDPVGFRDIRLHKHASPDKDVRISWRVPFVDYIKNDTVPLWIRALSAYDIPLRRGYTKLLFSHLFYVIGEKI